MAVDPRRMRPRKVPGAPPAANLPPHLAPLFVPNEKLPFKPAIKRRKVMPLTGVAALLSEFETTPPPEPVVHKTRLDRAKAKKANRAAKHKAAQAKAAAEYNPKEQITEGNAFNTLFITALNYETDEATLKREFEVFGPIVHVKIIRDQKGKSRGYAFVEFETEQDMKNAYKRADGKKIDGRRVTVDVERGRTVRGWLPRRLGGGLGSGRAAKPSKEDIIIAQRTNPFGGGMRGPVAPRAYVGGFGPRFSGPPRSTGGPDRYGGGGGSSRDRGRDRDRDRDRDRGRSDRDRDRDRGRSERGRSERGRSERGRSERGDHSRDRRRQSSRSPRRSSRRRSSRSRSPHRRSRR